MLQTLADNWLMVAVPVIAFLATWIIGLWLRRMVYNSLITRLSRTKWKGTDILVAATRRVFVIWFILLGIEIGIEVSALSMDAKSVANRVIGSLFVGSLIWALDILAERLLRLYLPREKTSERATIVTVNIARWAIIVVGLLVILDIWKISTTPLLIIILLGIVTAVLALRTTAPNLSAGFELNAGQHIKTGDYIKLGTGEEGYVTEIGWSNTSIKAIDESTIILPNSRLLQNTVVNYGRPLKKAKEPFVFMSRTYLKEVTGLKARNLAEFLAVLKEAPDAVIDYHIHHFLEEHNYLTPEPSNDFAIWVTDALGDNVLGERLASIDTFSFPNLKEFRDRVVSIIEEYGASTPNLREVMEGQEFYFLKSVDVVLPTTYIARDLREFVEALRKISTGSLYFHIFESRLRLGKGMNDFSIWLKESLDESEMGEEIARLDPYTYNLEGLRSTLIQLIEKRIK